MLLILTYVKQQHQNAKPLKKLPIKIMETNKTQIKANVQNDEPFLSLRLRFT